jgi:Fic family protein
MLEHIRNSNLIENIDDPTEDARSMRAWKYISKQPHIGIPELLETHRLITLKQLNKKEAGHFRTVAVWIGGYKIMPAPYLAQQMVYNLLMDLMQRPKEISPKEAHIRFESAHPFIDGNGRTGRMLMWWHEQHIGQEPSLIPIEKRQDYYQWFREQE